MDIDKIEFCEAMDKNKDMLHLLKLKYLAAQIREADLEDMFKQGYKRVLTEHVFCVSANKHSERAGLKAGDRITDEDNAFLMDSADFDRYLQHSLDVFVELGYVEQDGTYKPGFNGMEIRIAAENELIDFQISIFPEEIREAFKDIKNNYHLTHKFLDLIMGCDEKVGGE